MPTVVNAAADHDEFSQHFAIQKVGCICITNCILYQNIKFTGDLFKIQNP